MRPPTHTLHSETKRCSLEPQWVLRLVPKGVRGVLPRTRTRAAWPVSQYSALLLHWNDRDDDRCLNIYTLRFWIISSNADVKGNEWMNRTSRTANYTGPMQPLKPHRRHGLHIPKPTKISILKSQNHHFIDMAQTDRWNAPPRTSSPWSWTQGFFWNPDGSGGSRAAVIVHVTFFGVWFHVGLLFQRGPLKNSLFHKRVLSGPLSLTASETFNYCILPNRVEPSHGGRVTSCPSRHDATRQDTYSQRL